jgi:predicted house-cleaning noncanonical NTP pyrophosphatase (MazG superfamily)
MNNEQETSIAVETVFVLPRNQFYWSYRINEGATHTIKKEEIFDYLKEYVTQKNYAKLADLLARFRSFLILIKEDRVVELTKKLHDEEYYRKTIEDEIFSIASSSGRISLEKGDSLLKKVEEIQKKYW